MAAHVTGDNTEIIQPLNVTNTHVIISIQGFSLFGLLKILYPRPIKAQVLLFYKELRDKQGRKKLHIHLLPGNVPVKEVTVLTSLYSDMVFMNVSITQKPSVKLEADLLNLSLITSDILSSLPWWERSV